VEQSICSRFSHTSLLGNIHSMQCMGKVKVDLSLVDLAARPAALTV
jgi:hypothetical protein